MLPSDSAAPASADPARAGCQGVQSSLEGDRLASVWPGTSLPSFVPVTDHPGHLLAPTVQMGRLRLRAGDGQGQAAALVKSSRSEMGLAWILASPPTLPTLACAVDPRHWQCFLRKEAPQALPQISLCDVGWGGPALASGGVPSLGPGQSSFPLPQLAQTGCSPARPQPPAAPAPRVLAGIWGSSHCLCSPMPAAYPVGTSEDRPRVEEWLSSHP